MSDVKDYLTIELSQQNFQFWSSLNNFPDEWWSLQRFLDWIESPLAELAELVDNTDLQIKLSQQYSQL